MNYLTLEQVSKSFGEKVLFDKINLQISQGDKIALVAKNGTGKTTLLRVIAGEEAPEGEIAKILVNRNINIAYLEQDPYFNERSTVLEAVFESDHPKIQAIKQYEEALILSDNAQRMEKALAKMEDLKAWDFEARIKEILSKLNITRLDQPIATLSGGQRKRLALAKLLIEDPEFIILDEPTNHLDLDMIEWLEEYLQNAKLTIFMVTHDRYFLERVCNHIVELDRGNIYRYRGNYTDFLLKKAARQENEASELEKTRKLYRKELEWVNRMPKARGTKAKSRVDKFFEIKDKAFTNLEQDELKIDLKSSRLGSKILEAHNIGKAYGELTLVKEFDYKFKKGERVGIVGPNGVGKSTFLDLLTKAIRPDSGKVVVGGTVVFGYYGQEGMRLKEDKRVIDVIRDIAEYIPLEKGQKMTAATLLERFLFTRKQQQVYVSQLSGGEKRRLYLLTVLMANPNFLILDEPTNDLDILTLNVLENYLLDFPGCLLIVSHDRYFMDKLVDHLFVFEGAGKIRDFNGNYTEYREKAKVEALAIRQAAPPKVKKESKADPNSGLTQDQKKELKRLEKQIQKLEDKKASITEQFLDTSLSLEKIQDLSQELEQVKEEIEEKEMRWLELGEMGE